MTRFFSFLFFFYTYFSLKFYFVLFEGAGEIISHDVKDTNNNNNNNNTLDLSQKAEKRYNNNNKELLGRYLLKNIKDKTN